MFINKTTEISRNERSAQDEKVTLTGMFSWSMQKSSG